VYYRSWQIARGHQKKKTAKVVKLKTITKKTLSKTNPKKKTDGFHKIIPVDGKSLWEGFCRTVAWSSTVKSD